MTGTDAVDIVLDLRDYPRRLDKPHAFAAFWQELEPALAGKRLQTGKSHVLTAGVDTIGITVVRAPAEGIVVSDGTEISIRAILEPPALLYACGTCKAQGLSSYGPFICPTCQDTRDDARVCDNHVVILDGAMRSFCEEHAPLCGCGQAGTFWCQGPTCRRQTAWCDQHRRRHPRDPDHSFCIACYALAYPECEHGGCDRVGSLGCEHVDVATLKICGKRACPSHMSRWQIYGPEKEGLTLCQTHRGVARLNDKALVDEIILGTAARGTARRKGPFLPSLQSVRHILRKSHGRTYELDAIASLFSGFSINLDGAPPLKRIAGDLLAHHSIRRDQDRARDRGDKAEGEGHFLRLKHVLTEKGQFELAQLVVFSDYRPKNKWLFVTLPESHKGLLVGRGGSNIKEISARLGVDVKLERTDTRGSGR